MNKKILIFFLICLVALIIPIPLTDGVYNKVSGWYVCQNEAACWHEIAHKIDDEANWISHSEDFYTTVKSLSPSVERGFLNKNIEEIYATLLEYSRGDSDAMPEQLRRFYDFERAHELMQELR